MILKAIPMPLLYSYFTLTCLGMSLRSRSSSYCHKLMGIYQLPPQSSIMRYCQMSTIAAQHRFFQPVGSSSSLSLFHTFTQQH